MHAYRVYIITQLYWCQSTEIHNISISYK